MRWVVLGILCLAPHLSLAADATDNSAVGKVRAGEVRDSLKGLAPVPVDFPSLSQGLESCAEQVAGLGGFHRALDRIEASPNDPEWNAARFRALELIFDALQGKAKGLQNRRTDFERRRQVSAIQMLTDRTLALWNQTPPVMSPVELPESAESKADQEGSRRAPARERPKTGESVGHKAGTSGKAGSDGTEAGAAEEGVSDEDAAGASGKAKSDEPKAGATGKRTSDGPKASTPESLVSETADEISEIEPSLVRAIPETPPEYGAEKGATARKTGTKPSEETAGPKAQSSGGQAGGDSNPSESDPNVPQNNPAAPTEIQQPPLESERPESSFWDAPAMKWAKEYHDRWTDFEGPLPNPPPPNTDGDSASASTSTSDSGQTAGTNLPTNPQETIPLTTLHRLNDSLIYCLYQSGLRLFANRPGLSRVLEEVNNVSGKFANARQVSDPFWTKKVWEVLVPLRQTPITGDALHRLAESQSYLRSEHGLALGYLRPVFRALNVLNGTTTEEILLGQWLDEIFKQPQNQEGVETDASLEAQLFYQSLPGPLSRTALRQHYAPQGDFNWEQMRADLNSMSLSEYRMLVAVADLVGQDTLKKWLRLKSEAPFGARTPPNHFPPERKIVSDLSNSPLLIRDGDPWDDIDRFAMGELSQWSHRTPVDRPGRNSRRPKVQTFLLLDMSPSMVHELITFREGHERYLGQGGDPKEVSLQTVDADGESIKNSRTGVPETLEQAFRKRPNDKMYYSSSNYLVRDAAARLFLDLRMAEASSREQLHEAYQVDFTDTTIWHAGIDETGHQRLFDALHRRHTFFNAKQTNIAKALSETMKKIQASVANGGSLDSANIFLITDGVEAISQGVLNQLVTLSNSIEIRLHILALGEGNASFARWEKTSAMVSYRHVKALAVDQLFQDAYRKDWLAQDTAAIRQVPNQIPAAQWDRFNELLKHNLNQKKLGIDAAVNAALWVRLLASHNASTAPASLVLPSPEINQYLDREKRADIAYTVLTSSARNEGLLPEQFIAKYPSLIAALSQWVGSH